MLRTCVVAIAVVVGALSVATVHSQTPEITVTARSAQELGQVLASFGERGEMFGLTGPAAFLKSYGSKIDNQQPLIAAVTFTTKTPMFVTEFEAKDATTLLAALASDGVQFDAKSGELTKVGSSLRFYMVQNGNKLRIADNAEFLKNVRWPTPEQIPSGTAAIAHIDWRNLKPEMRSAVAQQAMTNFLPQTNPMAAFSIDALPELISNMAASRMGALFGSSESMTLQFSIRESGVQVSADVVNRSVAGRSPVPSPFASLTNENNVASFEWNTPVDSELRTFTQAWAAQLVGAAKHLFAGDEIGDTSGLKVLHEGAAVLARHCTETIALPNLQGSLCALSDGDRPIVVAGIRVANPARLDGELQKLIKSAMDNGAPFQFTPHVASSNDLSIHRVQVPIAAELTTARELFGETLTIHLATTSHALLFGFGNGSDKLLVDLVSPAKGSTNRWLDAVVNHETSPVSTKLGLKPCRLSVLPAAQGFQVNATLSQAKGPTQLTSTREEADATAQ